jgi:hypothetical protein
MVSNMWTAYDLFFGRFFKHTTEKGLGYMSHLKQAWTISFKMLCASAACFVHGIYPDIFCTTASNLAKDVVILVEREPTDDEFENIND